VSAAPVARAREPAPRIAVVTMTPGPRLFERFGHTAIVVADPTAPDEDALVYNYGTFDGDDPHLVRDFLAHRLRYWLSVGTWDEHLERYANRAITEQRLALGDDEARAVAARLARNALPDERAYGYDFFLDNCATRVRDVVDAATGGALRAGAIGRPGVATYREHVARVLGPGTWAGRFVPLLLNAFVDRPTTRWDDAFLPRELQAILADARRPDGRPLVASTTTIVGPDHRPERPARGDLGGALLALLALPLVGASLAPSGLARALARRAAGVALALAGLAGSALGIAIAVAAATPHPCSRLDANVLLLHPALALLVPAGVALARARDGARALSLARAVLVASLAVIAVDAAAHLAGFAHQRHLGLAALVAALELLALAATPHRSLVELVGRRDLSR